MQLDDLHPYDDKLRRFRHTDVEPAYVERGQGLVVRLLRLAALPAGVRYDLSFLSGGSGVWDRLYVGFPCAAEEVARIAGEAGFKIVSAQWETWETPDREDIEWLVSLEDFPDGTLAEAVAAFVGEERGELLAAPEAGMRVWFEPGSNVNHWAMIYAAGGELGYVAFDQG